MRDLKFRAWDKVKEEYIYSDKIAGGMWQYFKTLEDRGIRHFESEEFTGLLDKHNDPVYEGDVVQYKSQHTTTNTTITIVFNEEIFAFAMRGLEKWDCSFMKDMRPDEFEIIGNIHEGTIFDNPKLIK